MYLSNLRLWNFRKFGSDIAFSLDTPNLDLNLNPGLNVLIGENDSGKSAIIDSIRHVLKTHSYLCFDDAYFLADAFVHKHPDVKLLLQALQLLSLLLQSKPKDQGRPCVAGELL